MASSDQSSLRALAGLYSDIGARLTTGGTVTEVLTELTETALRVVPGAERVSITRGRPGSFETVGATDVLATQADAIQYALGSGPCVDAVLLDTVFRTGDLRTDPRWPEFGRQAFQATGALSMLSHRLFFEDEAPLIGLNIYATTVDAFDEDAQTIGTLLATHGSFAVIAAAARERIANLERAVASNRDIGVAMGVLMNAHKLTRDQAFDLLRIASQHTHRKLSDVAADVADTGALDVPPRLTSIK